MINAAIAPVLAEFDQQFRQDQMHLLSTRDDLAQHHDVIEQLYIDKANEIYCSNNHEFARSGDCS